MCVPSPVSHALSLSIRGRPALTRSRSTGRPHRPGVRRSPSRAHLACARPGLQCVTPVPSFTPSCAPRLPLTRPSLQRAHQPQSGRPRSRSRPTRRRPRPSRPLPRRASRACGPPTASGRPCPSSRRDVPGLGRPRRRGGVADGVGATGMATWGVSISSSAVPFPQRAATTRTRAVGSAQNPSLASATRCVDRMQAS